MWLGFCIYLKTNHRIEEQGTWSSHVFVKIFAQRLGTFPERGNPHVVISDHKTHKFILLQCTALQRRDSNKSNGRGRRENRKLPMASLRIARKCIFSTECKNAYLISAGCKQCKFKKKRQITNKWQASG